MRISLKYLIILLVVTKGIVWSALVPLWHFPDEQAHFAQVSYLAEVGKRPEKGNDLSEEILVSEKLLGTERFNGINQFTYHPEYRIPYTDSTIGLYEKKIAALSVQTRTNYLKVEAANYPPLYYLTLTLPYKVFYNKDLFTRVFASRIFNLVYVVLFTWSTWNIAKYIFPKGLFHQAAFTLFVNFQPMFTFVSSGVTSDNAINLWYALFIYLNLSILYGGLKVSKLLTGVFLITLGPFIKQQSLLAVPVWFGVLAYSLLSKAHQNESKKYALVSLGLFAVFLLTIYIVFQKLAFCAYVAMPCEPQGDFLSKLPSFALWSANHTIREVFPWYWGVFNWLGVVLPRLTNRIIIRVLGLAALGFVILVIRKTRGQRLAHEDKGLLFLFLLAIWYSMALFVWDYIFFNQYNYSFGMQGRYYFPTIIAHMGLLIWGIKGLIPERYPKVSPLVLFIMVIAMIMLNFHALWVVLGSYYSLNSWSLFFIQVSQYKPLFFKYPFLLIWIIGYIVIFIVTILKLFSQFRSLVWQRVG